jgi:hypothetical protein
MVFICFPRGLNERQVKSSPVALNLSGSINAAYAQAGAPAIDAKQNTELAVERASLKRGLAEYCHI